jgi:hypothetical protein
MSTPTRTNTIKAVRSALRKRCPQDIIKYKMEPLLLQKRRKTPKAPKKKTNKNNGSYNGSLKPRTLFN